MVVVSKLRESLNKAAGDAAREARSQLRAYGVRGKVGCRYIGRERGPPIGGYETNTEKWSLPRGARIVRQQVWFEPIGNRLTKNNTRVRTRVKCMWESSLEDSASNVRACKQTQSPGDYSWAR